MAITREKKESIVKEVTDAVKGASSAVFLSFKGLTVSETVAIRKALRNAGVKMKVAKKTLVRRALGDSGISGDMPDMPGELIFAYGDDLVAPAREIHEFVKKDAEKLKIVGGVFEKRFMNASQMMDIALIPPLRTLHAQFVNVINAPIQGLVIAFSEIAKKKES